MTLVQEWSDRLTHVVQADATNEAAMRQLGAASFGVAVVAIGTGIEASLLSTGVLIDLGVREVWAKAITAARTAGSWSGSAPGTSSTRSGTPASGSRT